MVKENKEVVAKEEVVVEEVAATETNEVAVAPEASVATTELGSLDYLADLGYSAEELAELTGLTNLKQSDISIPYAYLKQKEDTNTAKGDLLLPSGHVVKGWVGKNPDGTHTETSVLKGVSILNVQPVRVFFPEKFNPKNSFICRSIDGEVGAPDGEYAGRKCATCEFAQYPEGGGASPCRDQKLLLMATEDEVFHFVISGVGMKIFKDFITQQSMSMLPKVKNMLPLLRYDITVDNVATDYGPFAVLRFTLNERPIASKEEAQRNLGIVKSYREFSTEHFASAAAATQVDNMLSKGEAGENDDAF